MHLEEKGRIRIKLSELVEYLQTNENYSIAPLTLNVVLSAKSLHQIPELFDRMIAATSLEYDAVLLTRDPVFHNLSTIKIEW